MISFAEVPGGLPDGPIGHVKMRGIISMFLYCLHAIIVMVMQSAHQIRLLRPNAVETLQLRELVSLLGDLCYLYKTSQIIERLTFLTSGLLSLAYCATYWRSTGYY